MLEICRQTGIGAQFGGKYFAHDVRVIRLPRHGASCPVGLGVSCSADRQVLGKITRDGVFLEQLETNPARFLPEVTERGPGRPGGEGRSAPARCSEILAELRRHPVATRLSLSGPLIVARDIAHAKLKERVDRGEDLPGYFKDHAVYYAGPAKRPEGLRLGIVRPDHRRPHGRLRRSVPGPRRQHGHAGQGQPLGGGARGLPQARRLLPGLDRRPGGPAGRTLHQEGRGAGVPGAGHGGDLEDRGGGLPRLHRGRRPGQRLLRRPDRKGRRRVSRRARPCRWSPTDRRAMAPTARGVHHRHRAGRALAASPWRGAVPAAGRRLPATGACRPGSRSASP